MAARSALKSYISKYPSKLDMDNMTDAEWRKARTLELYDFLPQTTLEERYTYTDIRDEVIYLNYTFFGYIASHTYVHNTCVDYEDKLQSALTHFCHIWHKFKFAEKYRTDLAFTVFFKPRLSEEIQRELTTIKYSFERTIKMEAGKQLNKHWTQVRYEDIKDLDMPPNKIQALESIFGCMYQADLETHSLFLESLLDTNESIINTLYTDKYDTIVDLLVHEMVKLETKIDDKALKKISEIQGIELSELEAARPLAEKKLYTLLKDSLEMKEVFGHD